MKEVYGKKLGMTQIFNEDGTVVPVTVIEAYKLVVVGKKTSDKEGYNAIVVGFGDVKDADLNLSPKGDLCEAAANLFAYMRIADSQNKYSKIAMSPIPETGLGLAINDRIRRAAYK